MILIEVDSKGDDQSVDQVEEVGTVWSEQGVIDASPLHLEDLVHKENDCAFEFGVTIKRLNGGKRDTLPNDLSENVRRREETHTIAETVTFLQKLVKQDYEESCKAELQND